MLSLSVMFDQICTENGVKEMCIICSQISFLPKSFLNPGSWSVCKRACVAWKIWPYSEKTLNKLLCCSSVISKSTLNAISWTDRGTSYIYFPPQHAAVIPGSPGTDAWRQWETGSWPPSAASLSLESPRLNQSFGSLIGLCRHIDVLLETDWQARCGPVCARYWAGLNLMWLINLWFKILVIFCSEGNKAVNSKFSGWLIKHLHLLSQLFGGFLWNLKCLQEVFCPAGKFCLYAQVLYQYRQLLYLQPKCLINI